MKRELNFAEGILVTILGLTQGGLVLSWMWLWFVVPLGVVSITWIHGAGLVVMRQLFKNHNLEKETTWDSILTGWLLLWMFAGLGALVNWVMV